MLPSELVDAIAARIQKSFAFSEAPLLLFLSRFASGIKNVVFAEISNSALLGCLASETSLFLRRPGTMTSITFTHSITDAIFRALAESSLAQSLLKLQLSATCLTDDSVDCWKRFSALEALSMDSPFLTTTSYDELFLRLSRLVSLSITFENALLETIYLNKVLGTSPRYFPRLTDLSILSSICHAELILSLLERNRPLCTSLRAIKFEWPFGTAPRRLCELCPNLRVLPDLCLSWTDLQAMAQFMHHHETIAIADAPGASVTQENIEWLAATFPCLTSLKMAPASPVPFGATSLRSLSRLESLHLRCTSWNCFSFPSRLSSLKLDSSSSLAPFDSNKFIECGPTELRQLLFIELSVGAALPPAVLVAITTSLPNLETANFLTPTGLAHFGAPSSLQPPVEISHPNLIEFSEFGGVFATITTVPKRMPKLERLQLRPEYAGALNSSMYSLRACQAYGSGANLERLRELPALRQLTCFSPSQEQLGHITLLSRLIQLELNDAPFLQDGIWAQVLRSLPNLRSLLLHESGASAEFHSSFDWLQHDKLQKFFYRSRAGDAEKRRDVAASPIRFNGAHLPALLSLTVTLAVVQRLCLVVEGLPSLDSIALSALVPTEQSAADRATVTVRNCPCLRQANLSNLLMAALQMRNLPSMRGLHLHRVSILEGGCCVEIPSLRKYYLLSQIIPEEERQTMRAAIAAGCLLAKDVSPRSLLPL